MKQIITKLLLILGVSLIITASVPVKSQAATPYEQYLAEQRAKIAATVPDPEAMRVQLETVYGINIAAPAALKQNPETYAGQIYYCMDSLASIPAPWVQMVSNTSKAKTGKKLTLNLKVPTGEVYLAGTIADGTYSPKTNSINMNSWDSFTLAHEIGHAFYEVCHSKQPGFTETWQSYNVTGTYKGRANYMNEFTYEEMASFVDDYAMINMNEDFADTCAYTLLEYATEVQKGSIAKRPYLQLKAEYVKALSNAFAGAPIL